MGLVHHRAGVLLVGGVLGTQRIDLGIQHLALDVEVTLAPSALELEGTAAGEALRFEAEPGGAGEYARRAHRHRNKLDPLGRDEELANLIRVAHAARLDQREPARPLPGDFDVPHLEPRVDERGDAERYLLDPRGGAQRRHEGGDLPALEVVEEPDQHRLDLVAITGSHQAGDGVEDHSARLEGLDGLVHPNEVRLEAVDGGAPRLDEESFLRLPLPEVEANRRHVANDLPRRFLEREVQDALAPPAGSVREQGREAALAGARRAGHQHAGAAVVAATGEQAVERRHPGGHALAGDRVVEADAGHRQDGEAAPPDEERVLVGAVRGAAVLQHAQPSRGDLIDHSVVERDDAVGDVLLEAVAGVGAAALLTGYDGGDPPLLEPVEQSPQLRPQQLVREGREQCLERVEHHALGPDRIDGMAEAHEQSVEPVLADLLMLRVVEDDRVDREQLALDQVVEIEAEGRDVLSELVGALLEGDDHPGLAELGRAIDDELHREQRLAAARTAADERVAPTRQAALGDLVEPTDAGRRLADAASDPFLRHLLSRAGAALSGTARGRFRLKVVPASAVEVTVSLPPWAIMICAVT